MIFKDYAEADGFVFIGDPHLTSKKPNRRLESDNEIIKVTVDKLLQGIEIANSFNAIPVITGDLFTYAKDTRAFLMTSLFRALKMSKHKVICLPGNHDLLATEVTDDTALAAVAESGLILLFPSEAGPCGTFIMNGKRVGLGGVIHDRNIPEDISDWYTDKIDFNILVTHHDIAFEGAYPGSLDVFPVNGCDLIVNGHMHATKKPIVAGNTTWFNIGNIFRQTIADNAHVPAVWLWMSGDTTLTQKPLRYIKDVFDWTGKLVTSSAGSLIPDASDDECDSVFVSELSAAIGAEMPKSHDAGIIIDDINSIKNEMKPKDAVLTIIDALHEAVAKESINI